MSEEYLRTLERRFRSGDASAGAEWANEVARSNPVDTLRLLHELLGMPWDRIVEWLQGEKVDAPAPLPKLPLAGLVCSRYTIPGDDGVSATLDLRHPSYEKAWTVTNSGWGTLYLERDNPLNAKWHGGGQLLGPWERFEGTREEALEQAAMVVDGRVKFEMSRW
jgi:hypothetical protein